MRTDLGFTIKDKNFENDEPEYLKGHLKNRIMLRKHMHKASKKSLRSHGQSCG